VATSLYDCGTNFKLIGCLIMIHLPTCVEMIVQRIGRAGRDGKPCYVAAYVDGSDAGKRVHPDVKIFFENKKQCCSLAI
jgi:superfamily II DNA helicase RecQ